MNTSLDTAADSPVSILSEIQSINGFCQLPANMPEKS